MDKFDPAAEAARQAGAADAAASGPEVPTGALPNYVVGQPEVGTVLAPRPTRRIGVGARLALIGATVATVATGLIATAEGGSSTKVDDNKDKTEHAMTAK